MIWYDDYFIMTYILINRHIYFFYVKLYAPVFVICVFHVRMGIWKWKISKVINLNYNVDLYI